MKIGDLIKKQNLITNKLVKDRIYLDTSSVDRNILTDMKTGTIKEIEINWFLDSDEIINKIKEELHGTKKDRGLKLKANI